MNALVVGAGPAGSVVALDLASAGFSVELFEEHERIGRPIACTGIVTKVLFDFVKKDQSFIINELDGVKVYAPSGRVVDIPLKEFVICRDKFDNFLARQAEHAGVKISARHKFVGVKDGKAFFKHGEQVIKKQFDILVGADGPFSAVGRAAGLLDGRQYYVGSQATIKGNYDPRWFLTFFGGCAPGFFAWAVPESESLARVGVATKKHVYQYFELLRQKFGGEIIERQAGPIPIYDGAKHVQKGNIYLVGDAAGVCKNTTGGGIITGIWSARALVECLKSGKSYSKALNPLRRELWLHEHLRNYLDRFSDADYERLVELMQKPRVKRILFDYPREYPSRFLWRLALAEPRLLAFAKHALG
ncbi:NAD(P)/FAD-dependent oxidoreductase [Candidatus Woesearchaeota archaeon]|nr:NAD(P)/FAD-dependent oxidoreductase [Candidatus Woesearchaeota archaeon]